MGKLKQKDKLNMNTKEVTTHNKDQNATESETQVMPCVILCAASSDGEYTGVTYMYKFEHESNKDWREQSYITLQGEWPEPMILSAIDFAIHKLKIELGEERGEAPRKFTIETNADTIVRGLNEHRATWESCGFINNKGKKMLHIRQWKQLFKHADKHQITLRKPQEYAEEYKACKRLAKQACVEARAHGDNEEMRKFLEGVRMCAPNMEHLREIQDREKRELALAGRDLYKESRQACAAAIKACHSQT